MDAASDVDGQALAREFVDESETFEVLSVGTGIEYEVIGPEEIGISGRDRPWPGARYSPSATASRQLQLGHSPQPMCTMPTHVEAFPAQEDADATISVARILCRQPFHRFKRRCITLASHRLVFQGRAGYFKQLARTSLRQAAFTRHCNLLPTRLRAHHFRRLISLSVSISRSRSPSNRF